MLDQFQGEMTAKYVHEDDIRWAANERLIRQLRPTPDVRKSSRLNAKRLLHLGFLAGLTSTRSAAKA